MKKFMAILLAVMLVVGTASYLRAEVFTSRGGDSRVKTVAITSTTATLDGTISSGNVIYGLTVSDSSAGWGTLYDVATAVTRTSSTIFAEAYCAAGGVSTVIFPLPKKVINGLVAHVLNSTGVMIIYYE